MGDFPGNAAPLPEIDTSRPHPARIYDYGLATHTTAEHDPEGVVLVSEWRPDDEGPRPAPAEVSCYGGVARKP